MSTDAANVNNTDNVQTSDINSFINEPPYNFCWTSNNNGAKSPVFPYVISVLEPKSINANEEKTLKSYLEALIKNWKWKKEIPIIIIADKSGKTGEIVLETINFFKNQAAKRSGQKDANQLFFVRFQDQTELISRLQNETTNDANSSGYRNINAHLTIVFWQRENDENSQRSNIDAIKDHLGSLYPGFNEHALNSVLQIQPDNPDPHANNSSLPVYYYNIKNHSKNKVKAPSKFIKSLSNKNDLNNLKKINDVSQAFNENVKSSKDHLFDTKDNSIIQLLKISSYFHRLSDFCKKKMKHYNNIFCFAFLLIFMCNALLVYINSSCINSFGASVFQLARYCATGDNDNYFCDNVLTYKWVPIKIQTRISNDVIKSKIEVLKKSYISFYFFKISKAIFICTVFWFLIITVIPPLILILRCIYVHYFYYWHKKYHACQTLSDCLKIQAYLKYAGIKDNFCKDNLLSKQAPVWLSTAVIGIYASVPFDCDNSSVNDLEEFKKRIDYLDKRWMKKYAERFRQRVNKSGWNALELFSKVGVLLWSFVTFFFISFFIISHNYSWSFVWDSFRTFTVTAIIFLICGLLFYWSRSWAESNTIIQKLIRRLQKFDLINAILFFSIILCCLGGLLESHRLSNICSLSQNSCLSADSIFPFISAQSMNEEFILIRNLIISFVLVAFAFQRMEMFGKERKIISQLLYSFKNSSSDIYRLFIDSKKQSQLLDMAKNRSAYYSDVIKRINDCMIQKSDIALILEKISSQEEKQQPATVNIAKESFIKRTWNHIRSFFSFKRTIEIRQPAVPDDYIKKVERELNALRENKINNLHELKENTNHNPNVQMDSVIIEECQNILLRLGEEYLAKRIDWLLDVKDRDLKPPKS